MKRGYIGIGGKARPFWTGGELAYWGSSDDGAVQGLGENRSQPMAIQNGKYLLFAGGQSNESTYSKQVDVYTEQLTKSSATELTQAYLHGMRGTAGNKILFGQVYQGEYGYQNTMDVYDDSLTKSYGPNVPDYKVKKACVSFNKYLVFANDSATGGGNSNTNVFNVYAYNEDLTLLTLPKLPQNRDLMIPARVGDFCMFAGGYYVDSYYGDYRNYGLITVYNTDLTQVQSANMSRARSNCNVSYVKNDYVIFMLGLTMPNNVFVQYTDAYNKNLTATVLASQPTPRITPSASVSLGDFAVFSGGTYSKGSSYYFSKNMILYNEELTKSTGPEMKHPWSGFSGGAIDEFAVFAGGMPGPNTNERLNFVEVYKI